MRSALPNNAPSRPWWSRSKSSRDSLRTKRSVSSFADEDEKYPSPASSTSSRPRDALKLNSLASAIGFKSKKLPALTIQDPPSPLAPTHAYSKSRPISENSASSSPAPSSFYSNRPPAKSVSTVRSSEYDYDAASEPHSEPRTPSDHPRDRLSYQHSVMTFSEIDSFASGGIVVQPLPQDPNRLSVYSDSSMLDPQHKRPDIPPPINRRVSYGSSSSNSHGNYSDLQALSPMSATSFGRSPTAIRSAHDLMQNSDQYSFDQPSLSETHAHRARRTKTPSGSNSSNSTLTHSDYRSRMSEPPGGVHLPRQRSSPALGRARGMTVGTIDHQRSPPLTAVPILIQSTRPPQLVRQPSTDSSSPSSSNTPSPSPVVFSNRNASSATLESPVSPNSTHPLVLVRKASSSRGNVPPLPSAAPPATSLPPTPSHRPPLPASPYGSPRLEFRASSSSSSLNFAPSVDLHDLDPDDPISQILNSHYDLGPFEPPAREAPQARELSKVATGKNRDTYILDGDLSLTGLVDADLTFPSPLSKFPPVPTLIHGEVTPKAAKLLRKMPSQQNFSQRHSATSTAASVRSTPSTPLDDPSGHGNGHPYPNPGKAPRKQRSFHAPRGIPLSIPPLPSLRSSASSSHPSTTIETLPPPSPVIEPRRGNVTTPRKRLFSGSSARRSTSSHGQTSPGEADDKRSVFSLDSDSRPSTSIPVETLTMSFGAAGGPLSLTTRHACISPSSLWEDGTAEDGKDKRMSQSEYVPQYIMAPAEQLKLAEKLDDEEATVSIRGVQEAEPDYQIRKPTLDLHPGDFGLTYSPRPRSRSNSVMSSSSTGTLAFGDKFGVTRGASILSSRSSIMSSSSRPSPTSPTSRKMGLTDAGRGGPSRATSLLAKAVNKPPSLNARPSSAQSSTTPPLSPRLASAVHNSHSSEPPSASLPPPPRQRPARRDFQESAAKRVSIVPMNPLSPPPMRTVRPRHDSTGTASTIVSPPPSAFDRQKIMKRRSLMKKPSFLDIEDEHDGSAENVSEEEGEVPPESPTMESSFLDMDRGKNSFDTLRSAESADYV